MPRTWALAGIVLLAVFAMVGSSLAGGVGAASTHAGASVAPLGVRGALSTDEVYSTNCQYGYYEEYFAVTTDGDGQVCFYAYDPSDTVANVSIIDQNATRDGLPNPVVTWEINLTGPDHSNSSYLWDHEYSIPWTLTHAGLWNLTISGKNGGNYTSNFEVETYYVEAISQPYVVLPGQQVTTTFTNYATINMGPYTPTTMQAYGVYYGTDGAVRVNVTTPIAAAPSGSFILTVPKNATIGAEIYLYIYSNTSTGPNANWSEYTVDYIGIGALAFYSINFGASPFCDGSCYSEDINYLEANTTTYVGFTIEAEYEDGTAPQANAAVRLTFQADHKNLTGIPGSPLLSGTTNGTGGFDTAFLANTSTFAANTLVTLIINVTSATDPNASVQQFINFTVESTAAEGEISLAYGAPTYYSGQMLTVFWAIHQPDGSLPQGYTGDWYEVYGESFGEPLFGSGFVTAGQTNGTITVPIPASYTGYAYVDFYALNATSTLYGYSEFNVLSPGLFLSDNPIGYSPGQMEQVQVTELGFSSTSPPTLFGTVFDEYGNTVWSGTITGTTVSWPVPKTDPSEYYEVTVAAESGGTIIASAYLYVDEETGVQVTVSITTASQYADDAYQPGESVQITYHLDATGGAVLPSPTQVWIYPEDSDSYTGATSAILTSGNGSLSYTIPSGTPDGIQYYDFEVEYKAGSGDPTGCEGNCYSYGYFSVLIQGSPHALDMELGGSGITLGWLILLIVIVVVAIVLVLLILRRKSGPRAGPLAPAAVFSGSSPPDAASNAPPSGAGRSNWSETPDAGGGAPPSGSPPLPVPPQNP
jgi:hypothetical protein